MQEKMGRGLILRGQGEVAGAAEQRPWAQVAHMWGRRVVRV